MNLYWKIKSSHMDVAIHLLFLPSIIPLIIHSSLCPLIQPYHTLFHLPIHLLIYPPSHPFFIHLSIHHSSSFNLSTHHPSFLHPFILPLIYTSTLSLLDYSSHLLIFPTSSVLPFINPSINELFGNMKQQVHGIEHIWYLRSLQNKGGIEFKWDQKALTESGVDVFGLSYLATSKLLTTKWGGGCGNKARVDILNFLDKFVKYVRPGF